MAKLTWDDTGKRLYETGVKQGVLYLLGEDGTYKNAVAWNGSLLLPRVLLAQKLRLCMPMILSTLA